MRLPGSDRRAALEEYRELCRVRLEHVVAVREPLVLVSQVQRSGGTLLSQLFDGHPECHAHPSEIYIGHPRKWEWPPLDLSAPETWFDVLYESPVELHLREGYVKHKEARLEPGHDVFPFVFLPHLQRAIFEQAAAGASTERDVLDAYFTSYFNAWLDNQNLYAAPKKVVTGFTPQLGVEPGNAERLFAAYPDGTLISIVRDPAAWYESASKYRERWVDLDGAIAEWTRSTQAALDAAGRFGDRVLVLTYEQLVLDTEGTMWRVADRIGIERSPALLEPTFNGRPVRANSSGPVSEYGILKERTTAYRRSLDAEAIARIDELARSLYAEAEALAAPVPSVGE
ncbi:MAG: sulfotransferase [Verrucomicrobiota bacterium]